MKCRKFGLEWESSSQQEWFCTFYGSCFENNNHLSNWISLVTSAFEWANVTHASEFFTFQEIKIMRGQRNWDLRTKNRGEKWSPGSSGWEDGGGLGDMVAAYFPCQSPTVMCMNSREQWEKAAVPLTHCCRSLCQPRQHPHHLQPAPNQPLTPALTLGSDYTDSFADE